MIRSAKSVNSLVATRQSQQHSITDTMNNNQQPQHPPHVQPKNQQQQHQMQEYSSSNNNINNNATTSPICRCRVMYLGSTVPYISKDGLQGIQEPLRELYPNGAALASGNFGIDSWLSIWSNGILIENVDDTGREVKKFFKIEALHYCAAVKYVPMAQSQQPNPYSTMPKSPLPKFLPLDTVYARQPNPNPPIFASVFRRTTGIKVLECHGFICKRESAANALVRCCFHAYADTMYALQIGADLNNISISNMSHANGSDNNNNTHVNGVKDTNNNYDKAQYSRGQSSESTSSNFEMSMGARRAKSVAALDECDKRNELAWRCRDQNNNPTKANQSSSEDQQDGSSSIIRNKSADKIKSTADDNYSSKHNGNLQTQQKFSKSMHQLNNNGHSDHDGRFNMSANAARNHDSWLIQQVNQQSYHNPYASRVPSYPPQSLIDGSNNGGTLRSIKSMAANSIASTLLRSKKHAKAMSMAQLNQEKMNTMIQQQQYQQNGLANPLLMPPNFLPPVPLNFAQNLSQRAIVNGSQTMRPLSRPIGPPISQPAYYETLTPKEIKKIMKKNAKYGINPTMFAENGLPVFPVNRAPMLLPSSPPSQAGTMISQTMMSDMYDLHGGQHLPPSASSSNGLEQPQLEPILVKPNAEFLKSKAGKKWLKQQKQFKKLLPPHLDGLPIVFGPPPVEALEAVRPNNVNVPVANFVQAHPVPPPLIPRMDSSGYYHQPSPFYGQNSRASTTSTLVRYSPNSQMTNEYAVDVNGLQHYTNGQSSKMNTITNHNHINGNNNHLHDTRPVMSHKNRDYTHENSGLLMNGNETGMDLHSFYSSSLSS